MKPPTTVRRRLRWNRDLVLDVEFQSQPWSSCAPTEMLVKVKLTNPRVVRRRRLRTTVRS